MKKLFAFISVLAVAAAGLFAEITAKKLADGKIEATFFYGNPRATEVLVAGDFTNWQAGALPMEKTDKGFTLTKTFDAGTTVRYKFISDGNWTTDLRAPDFIDDGFGGKNSVAELDSLVAGDADGAKKYPNVKFNTWSMLGMETKFSTQDKNDKTSKETNAESIAMGFKSYNKLSGDLTGNMPFYLELVLAEQEYEDAHVKLYSRENSYDDNVDLVKHAFGDLFSDPQAWLANDTSGDVNKKDGKTATVPFAGHIKFGWNTPFVNYTTGYKYAKLPLRQVITWSTIADNWDAGYENVGGYSLFENGEKLQKIGDYNLNFGLNLNRSADRKGHNYGTYAFATLDTGAWKFDAQWNTMYGKDYQFYDPVENDVIIGAKGKIGDVLLAVQGLVAIHNKSTKDLLESDYEHAGDWWKAADYFGYSTDIFYRSGDFDGIENLAGNAQASWKNDVFSAKAEYRFRGMEASMLYVKNNHDDNDLRLYDMLGAPNSQRFTVDLGYSATEALSFGLNAYVESELKNYDTDSDIIKGVQHCWATGYASSKYTPIALDGAGAEFEITPSVTYKFTDLLGFESSLKGYAIMDIASYKPLGATDDYEYSASDSKFLFKYAGLAFNASKINDTLQGLDVYYGLDNSNDKILGNTLIGKATLPSNIEVSAGIGIRSVKNTDAADAFDKDGLNPFGFGVGIAKRIKAIKSPKLYAQFLWNMDIYKKFGDGPTDLNLKNGANLGDWKDENGNWKDANGLSRYDGAGALRIGMQWDF